MNVPERGPLLTFRQTLTVTHIGASLDALHDVREALASNHLSRLLVAQSKALSVVLHSFAAIESAVNNEGQLHLFEANSTKYIPPEKRDLGLELIARNWPRNLPVVDKLRFLAGWASVDLPPSLEAEVRELTTFRNWIAHGVIYSTTLLISPADESSYHVHDREDSIEWRKKFPRLKFNSLDRLNDTDASKVVDLMFRVLALLVSISGLPVGVARVVEGRYSIGLIEAGTSNETKFMESLVRERGDA